MRVDTKKLIEFFKKINMDGNEKIEEILLDFTESGLSASAVSPSKVNRVDGVLKTSVFEDYSAIGKVGIQNLSNIIKILGKFNEKMTILVEGNTIKFSDKSKNMTTELIDIQFIKAVQPLKEMAFDDFFTINSSVIKEVIDDASINDEFKIQLETVEKGIKITNLGKYKFNRNLVVEEAKGGVKVEFATPFINGIKNLTGKLEMNLKSDFPLKVLEKTEDSVVSVIVAPQIKAE